MSDTSRIAKNTLFLYFRQILIMLVSLYTVRVVLGVLGAEDYGIYNVVAGVVTMLGFLSGAMATASQRYFSFDLGKGDTEHLKTTFSVTLQIYLLIMAFVVLAAETAGLWFVNRRLVIPPERTAAANVIYQAAIVSFVLTLTTTPYMACIIARENMNVYAYASIAEAVLKLAAVFVLRVLPFDKLALYGILLAAVAFVNTGIYRLYCRRNYAECRFRPVRDRRLFREIVGYSGWNLFGSLVGVFNGQIMGIALNQFCGAAVNAARAVSLQVSSAVNSFSSNFSTAVRPQIIKRYALDENRKAMPLVFRSCKLTYFLTFVFALPLCAEMNGVLSLWLKNVPQWTAVFSRLSLADALLTSATIPIMTLAQATGKIKLYQGAVGGVLLLNLPISFALLKMGFPPYSVFLSQLCIALLAAVLRILIVRKTAGFSLRAFLRKVVLPLAASTLLSLIAPFLLLRFFAPGILRIFLSTLFSVIFSSLALFLVALDKDERCFVMDVIKERFRRKR